MGCLGFMVREGSTHLCGINYTNTSEEAFNVNCLFCSTLNSVLALELFRQCRENMSGFLV